MEFIFIILSWMILLVPGFDDSVPPTDGKIFKIETSPDIVQSIKTKSDESFDFAGFDIELKQNSTGALEIKIPKNLPTPASFIGVWTYNEIPYVEANGPVIDYDIIEDPCYFHYMIPIEDKTNVEIVYPVIATGTWQLYSPIQFDENHPCYNKVFYEKPHESPLKQFKSGIPIEEIKCKEGLELIFKSSNRNPACVKPETAIKLVERGWAESKLVPQKEEFNFEKARNEVLFSLAQVRKAHGFEIEFDKDLTSKQKEAGNNMLTYKLIHEKDGWVGDLTFYSGKPDVFLFPPSSFDNIFRVKFFMSNEQGINPSSTWRPFLKSVISPLVPEWNSLNTKQTPAQWIEDILNNVSPSNGGDKTGELKSSSKEIQFSYNNNQLGYAELIINEKITQ